MIDPRVQQEEEEEGEEEEEEMEGEEETEEERKDRLAQANQYNKALFYVATGGETVRRLLRSATQGSFTGWDLMGNDEDRQAMVQILLSGMEAAEGRGGGGEGGGVGKADVSSRRVAL